MVLFHLLCRITQSPFFKGQQGFLGRLLGGFQFSGVTSFESGVPFTVFNIFDADGIGGGNDRPTFNPNGQRGVRAVPVVDANNFITGYINPEIVIARTPRARRPPSRPLIRTRHSSS